jgi:hypothetical protein
LLEGNLGDEMGLHILGHFTQRNEHFKENRVLQLGGDANNTNGDKRKEKAEDLQLD